MSKRQVRKKHELPFDFFAILKYIVMCVFFGGIAYIVKSIVMSALAMSPTHQAGNRMVTLYEVHNTGAAFNLFSNQPEMIITASFLTVAVIAFIVLVTSSKLNHSIISAMAFLSAGISLNLYERLTLGYVVDYIHINTLPNFPVFNVPDIMIVFGALGLILSIIARK